MNILFLGYWNLNDPLTRSTIYPHLKVLQAFPQVKLIVFVNTERSTKQGSFSPDYPISKIIYVPIASRSLGINLITKIYDFIHFPKKIKTLIRKYSIDVVIARGAPAGSLIYLVWRELHIPYMVESFEPHAEYMLASGTWSRMDPRYLFQKLWESKQKQTATLLATVSKKYKALLLREGIDSERVHVLPCSTDTAQFYYSTAIKDTYREILEIPNQAIVGVYAGKFGGLYFEAEAFKLFKGAFDFFGSSFYLFILTSIDKEHLKRHAKLAGLPLDRVKSMYAPFQEMNNWLNVANFGFAPYKETAVSAYLSPVKIGEYWSCGLPVMVTKGVGDEADFLEPEGVGVQIGKDAILSNEMKREFEKIEQLIKDQNTKYRCLKVVKKYRGDEVAKEVYSLLLNMCKK